MRISVITVCKNSAPHIERAINSVLEPIVSGNEGYLLSGKKLASTSIDSSDGLIKSLRDLMLSNKDMGFEIEFNENLIDQEAIEYSNEFNISLENTRSRISDFTFSMLLCSAFKTAVLNNFCMAGSK